ncbi:MAG TPA: DoxX family protein [Terriglobales bacterium]|nr:DoxX family protein [Terriglobales bacterium]
MNTAASAPAREARPRLTIIGWIIRAAVAFVFISTGLEKFSIGGGAEWIRIFHRIGYGDWFRYLTGALEIGGGLLLIIPPLTTVGAAALIACMVGAIFFHIFALGDPFSSIINIGLTLAILAAAREPKAEDLTTLSLS